MRDKGVFAKLEGTNEMRIFPIIETNRLVLRELTLLREYESNRGKFVDQYCYSLLKSEYRV